MRHSTVLVVALALVAALAACSGADDPGYTCPNVSCGPPPGPEGGPKCCPAGTTCCFGFNVCCPGDKPHYGTDGKCWSGIPPSPIGLRTVCGVPAN